MIARNLNIILLFKFNHNYEVFFGLQCTSILRIKNPQLSQKDTCSIAMEISEFLLKSNQNNGRSKITSGDENASKDNGFSEWGETLRMRRL